MSEKLTDGQRLMLKRAASRADGNPWPTYSMRERAGGAKLRMALELGRRGLMSADGTIITFAGRKAIGESA